MNRSHSSTLPPPPDIAARASDWADHYATVFGWLALPANGKLPIGEWRQSVLPFLDPDKLRKRWIDTERQYGPVTNIALVLGVRSGVVVADVDPRHGGMLEALWARAWPQDTVIAQSGGDPSGWHVYAACSFEGLPSNPRFAPGTELKADGAIVILPPSVHPTTGHRYQWLEGHAPWEIAIPPLPESLEAEAWQHARRAHTHQPDSGRDPDADPTLVYSPEKTLRLVTNLLNWSVDQTRKDRWDREHRGNMAYKLGQQLGALGLTDLEIVAVTKLYERMVRDVQ